MGHEMERSFERCSTCLGPLGVLASAILVLEGI